MRQSPSGSFLVARESDDRGKGLLRIWTLPEVRALAFTLPVSSTPRFALAPRGKYLAAEASEPGASRNRPDRYVDVWDVDAAKRVARIPRDDDLRSIRFPPEGAMLYTLTESEVRAWELPAGKLKARFGHEKDVAAVRFSADGRFLATISKGRVYVWDAASGELLSQLTDIDYVRDVRFSPDGRYLFTGASDGTAALWLWRTKDLGEEACKRLPRNLTADEWRRYLGDTPYRDTCPGLAGKDQR